MAQVQRFCCDNETGEITFYNVNNETGEPTPTDTRPPAYPFPPTPAAPSPRPVPPANTVRKYTTFPRSYQTKTKKFQSLKAKIIEGSNPTSHRLLLIPTTVMIFSGFLCVMLMILEVFLHVRCHKKNKQLKNPNLYYRSPFHMVTSAFCGVCKEKDSASKVGQLQDQRRDRYDYLKSLAL